MEQPPDSPAAPPVLPPLRQEHLPAPAKGPLPPRPRPAVLSPPSCRCRCAIAATAGRRGGRRISSAVWDAILVHRPAPRKATASLDFHRAFYGTLKPVMRGGRHVATLHSTSNDAVLQLYRQDLADRRLRRRADARSQVKRGARP